MKGDWKGWNFKLLTSTGGQLGTVTKKWAGVGRELFTSADNYVIALDEKAKLGPEMGALLLAAGLAIDIVYKEKQWATSEGPWRRGRSLCGNRQESLDQDRGVTAGTAARL